MKTPDLWLIRFVYLIGFIVLTSCEMQQARAISSSLCWRSLEPDTGKQDIGLAKTEPMLASGGPDEAWMAWEEDGTKILRWTQKGWSRMPAPVRHGVEMMRYPVISMTPSAAPILTTSANGKDGVSALHVARWKKDAWQWLGAPLLSSYEPFTHAHEARIAFGHDSQPIVAWSEERHVMLAGLFVSQWDGNSWQRLGSLKPEGEEYYLSPTIYVDTADRIWLGWREGRNGKRLRVARWDGSSWHDIGRSTLQNISEDGGMLDEPSLAVDSKGNAWLLWLLSKRTGGSSLILARWAGTGWEKVAVPRAPDGKDATVWSAQMILPGDLPIIAWSQADATDNHRLFIAELTANNQWQLLITGLHLAEGVSDVTDVRLAPGDARSFFVSWDEAGKDSRRTRLIWAYPCGDGETPCTPPKSIVERDTWPKTVNEAAMQIARELDDESKNRLRKVTKDDLIQYHLSWGMGIRNSLGLLRGNDELLKSCGNGKRVHPDNCSTIIMEAVWDIVRISAPNHPPTTSRQK